MAASTNKLAQTLKSLHKPGVPLVLANVYDIPSARAVAALPSCKALATASYAVAQAAGLEDDDLDLETNLQAAARIASVAKQHGKPLTVDVQDGYGDNLEEAITRLVRLGVAGVNLEDLDSRTHELYEPEVAVERIKRALASAAREGVADFVVNARCDELLHGGELADAISRGRRYLAAGATTVFVWGGSKRGVSREEVVKLVEAFDGRLNVSMKIIADGLNVKELAEIGVARISVGPQLQILAMKAYADKAEGFLSSV
jgi:2-methylisocitrate lyase-like PEP mutase family enzyme